MSMRSIAARSTSRLRRCAIASPTITVKARRTGQPRLLRRRQVAQAPHGSANDAGALCVRRWRFDYFGDGQITTNKAGHNERLMKAEGGTNLVAFCFYRGISKSLLSIVQRRRN